MKKNLLPLIRESFSSFNKDLMEENKGDSKFDIFSFSLVGHGAETSTTASTKKYSPAPPAPALAVKKTEAGVIGALSNIETETELRGSTADVFLIFNLRSTRHLPTFKNAVSGRVARLRFL
jgi:hypothetical protein